MHLCIHVIQNFPPSNLNRDDTGAPKRGTHGGVPRDRHSSQSWKRAVRMELAKTLDSRGVRTRRLPREVAATLAARGRDPGVATAKLATMFNELGIVFKTDADGANTAYLLYLVDGVVQRVADALDAAWDDVPAMQPPKPADSDAPKSAKKSKRPPKIKNPSPEFKTLIAELKAVLTDAKAPDIALHGRMVSDQPDWNVDAAARVAHAISINASTRTFDYFSAVDDLQPDDDSGAGHIATKILVSPCMYRYETIDVDQLAHNLGNPGDDVVRGIVGAAVHAFVTAMPTGMQSGTAALVRPSYVLVERSESPASLVNAFIRPPRLREDEDVVDAGIRALEDYRARLAAVYGAGPAVSVADRPLDGGPIARCETLDDIVAAVTGWVE